MIGARRLGTLGFEVTEKTIEDFGAQWTRNTDNEGYYGSVQLLYDIVGGLVLPEELRGARVADIGSGTGRIVNMLLDGEVQSVIAVEPSAAFDVLKVNTAARASTIEYVRGPGEALPAELDFVFSLGVIHHIPKPDPVLRAAYASLRPGGSVVLWLYGYEGNEVYLAVARPLRLLTTHLPDAVVDVLSAEAALSTSRSRRGTATVGPRAAAALSRTSSPLSDANERLAEGQAAVALQLLQEGHEAIEEADLAVDAAAGQVRVAGEAAVHKPPDGPDGVDVPESKLTQPSGLEAGPDHGAVVASIVAGEAVHVPVQPGVRGQHQDELAAGPKKFSGLTKRALVVADVLEDVAREDRVERRRPECSDRLLGGDVADLEPPAFLRRVPLPECFHAVQAQINRDDLAIRQILHVVARAAAHVEHPPGHVVIDPTKRPTVVVLRAVKSRRHGRRSDGRLLESRLGHGHAPEFRPLRCLKCPFDCTEKMK